MDIELEAQRKLTYKISRECGSAAVPHKADADPRLIDIKNIHRRQMLQSNKFCKISE